MLKKIIILGITAILSLCGAAELLAQKYPDRPITLVIPMAPGDALDVVGRLMGEELSKLLKVPVSPLNKPGASSTLGTDMVAKAKKDGYTILLANNASMAITKILEPEIVSYDPFKDFTPLGLSHNVPAIVVAQKDTPYKNLKGLVEYAKKNPQKIRCGTPGVKSIAGFNIELIQVLTDTKITGVPFKGATPSVAALLGGHIEIGSLVVTPYLPHLRSGEVRGMVISKHFPEFSDIPTLKQLGYGQDLIEVWGAFFAPADVSEQVIGTLVPALEKVVRNPAIFSKLADLGIQSAEYETPDKIFIRLSKEYKMVEEITKRFKMGK